MNIHASYHSDRECKYTYPWYWSRKSRKCRVWFPRFAWNSVRSERYRADREGGKSKFAEADGISRTFHWRYDNRVGYLLHHLTVYFWALGAAGCRRKSNWQIPERHWTAKWGGGRCRRYFHLLGVVIVTMVLVVVVLVVVWDAKRAYKLHTIALTSAILKFCSPTCPAKIALRTFQLIYLMPRFTPSRKEKKREKWPIDRRIFPRMAALANQHEQYTTIHVQSIK